MGKRKSVVGRIICFFLLALMFIVFASSADAQRLPGPTPTPTPTPPPGGGAGVCQRTITANVVALDQPFFQNRLGAFNPNGMMYALKRDVVNKDTLAPCSQAGANCTAGNVMLRPDKRPRPIVLRMNAGDCLQVNFTNLLTPFPPGFVEDAQVFLNGQLVTAEVDDQPRTREAGVHVNGMQLVGNIAGDGSFVGANASSLAAPGQTRAYTFYAESENVHFLHSMGATVGAEGGGGSLSFGLFGTVNVEPTITEWYRSHVTHEELVLATVRRTPAGSGIGGQPVIDYDALYPNMEPFISEGKANLPILNMQCTQRAVSAGANCTVGEVVHTDIEAIITGAGRGPITGGPHVGTTYSQFPSPSHEYGLIPVSGDPVKTNRNRPFREITAIFHDETFTVQAFPEFFEDPVLEHTLHGVRDTFAINYGTGGIGSEILANVLGLGPMWDCVDCKYEEFFLTSWAVGDPAMVVDIPANADAQGNPDRTPGPKANFALYPDDPSNVHHTYLSDPAKFRNIHAGPNEHHVFHLHGQQWTFSPLSDRGLYVDFQEIGPGAGYTYEILFGGSGNRNKHVGDMIYHCHFYPHFAQGMWALWRVHDVFEEGTELEGECQKNFGTGAVTCAREPFALRVANPVPGARVLPDGEVQIANGECVGMCEGTPIPAVVPLPGFAMPPMPAVATLDPADPRKVSISPNPSTGEKNPGFPFFIAGVAGHRPPTPPLDIIDDGGLPRHVVTGCETVPCVAGSIASTPEEANYIRSATRVDFNKEFLNIQAEELPEDGTQVEKDAMDYHAVRKHRTFISPATVGPSNTEGRFVTNGQPPRRGAPYADPCVDEFGALIRPGATPFFVGAGANSPRTVQFGADNPRVYKAAVFQFDVVLNRAGWHFNQQRILSLWDDVEPTLLGTRPAEPLSMRLNTLDCYEIHHTNLVPDFYELDDYQVRTPTDVIGQHMHMVKFDITSSDGAANGWNYEDGTLSPDDVRHRIEAINAGGGLLTAAGRLHLEPSEHPFFRNAPEGACPNGRWCGARTTVQRGFADPLLDSLGFDNGLRNVFTHDHYGPSTHQQVGLYATILIEPNASRWFANETDTLLGTRHDGGPTSWQARIVPPNPNNSFREFYLEWADFQHAYRADWDGRIDADSFRYSVNPSVREADPEAVAADPKRIYEIASVCPGGVPRPCPEAISADDPGTFVVNYRNEPLGLRVFDPNKPNAFGSFGDQTDGLAGDLAFVFQSRTDRAIPELNAQMASCVRNTPLPARGDPGGIDPANPVLNFIIGEPLGCPQLSFDVRPGDPGTPMMRVYDNDLALFRIQVGATEESHNATIHGFKWLQEHANLNSGWRNSHSMAISEMFIAKTPVVASRGQIGDTADYLYNASSSTDGFWHGPWGLIRAYAAERNDLRPLPNNVIGRGLDIPNIGDFVFDTTCPRRSPVRAYNISAVRAADVLPLVDLDGDLIPETRTLVYNARRDAVPNFAGGPLHDPTALLYVETARVLRDASGRPVGLTPGTPIEPLVLRANSGDCVRVTLRNELTLDEQGLVPDLPGWWALPSSINLVDGAGVPLPFTFNANQLRPSSSVGLHTQLLEYDVTRSDGANIGINPVQTVPPGQSKTYTWYAGDQKLDATNFLVATPVEFGGVNLLPADLLKQTNKGLAGALVIEPTGSIWTTDPGTRAQATVAIGTRNFREFVSVYQTNANLRFRDNIPVPALIGEGLGAPEDAEDAGQKSINYRTEPSWFRLGIDPRDIIPGGRDADQDALFSNTQVGAQPQTPIYTAKAGTRARFHMLQPGGGNRNFSLAVHGHLWEREPYNASAVIQGPTLITDNLKSQRIGAQSGFGAYQHFTFDLKNGAGGQFRVTGDYLVRPQNSLHNMEGMWNIFRVTP
jgi:hypothetical protein